MLLVILWKLGIPSWARKTLWTLSIGNRLEVTELLYQHLKDGVYNQDLSEIINDL